MKKNIAFTILLIFSFPKISAMIVGFDDKPCGAQEFENFNNKIKNIGETLKNIDLAFDESFRFFVKEMEKSCGIKKYDDTNSNEDPIGDIAKESVCDIGRFSFNSAKFCWKLVNKIYSAPFNDPKDKNSLFNLGKDQ